MVKPTLVQAGVGWLLTGLIPVYPVAVTCRSIEPRATEPTVIGLFNGKVLAWSRESWRGFATHLAQPPETAGWDGRRTGPHEPRRRGTAGHTSADRRTALHRAALISEEFEVWVAPDQRVLTKIVAEVNAEAARFEHAVRQAELTSQLRSYATRCKPRQG